MDIEASHEASVGQEQSAHLSSIHREQDVNPLQHMQPEEQELLPSRANTSQSTEEPDGNPGYFSERRESCNSDPPPYESMINLNLENSEYNFPAFPHLHTSPGVHTSCTTGGVAAASSSFSTRPPPPPYCEIITDQQRAVFYAYSPNQISYITIPPNHLIPPHRNSGRVLVSEREYGGHVALACFTFWCCGYAFGLIAFVLALLAYDYASNGNSIASRKAARASLYLSLIGIVVGMILFVTYII